VITPFSLRDLRLLGQLQTASVSLCPIEALTRPRSPLSIALVSLLPFHEARSLTFVLNERRRNGKRLQGFIQARRPLALPRLYIGCLVPNLSADEDGATVWGRLINRLVDVGAKGGIERIFACAGKDSPELDVLLQAGFNSYAREDLFRSAPVRGAQLADRSGLRPEQSADEWEINRLYQAVTPHLVQQAESPTAKRHEWLCAPILSAHGEGLVIEDRAGICGYAYLSPGRTGHWLQVLAHPRAVDHAWRLLDGALSLLSYYPPRPVYCAVRAYQGGLRALLEDRQFEPFSTQCCLVRHTTARVAEAVRPLVPALEKRVNAPTTTASSTDNS